MMQCRSSSDIYDDCLRHDVTGETTLIVSRNDGDWMTLVVWQDRDDVLSYQVSIATESTKKSSCTGQCYYFTFTGTSICVNYVQVLLVPVTDHPQGTQCTQGTGLGPPAFGGPQLQNDVL